MDFLAISGCETHFKSKLRQNQLRSTWRSCKKIFSIERRFQRFKS